MIDLSALDAVTVDPEARRARCGGGAKLGAARRGHPGARARRHGGHRQPHRRRRPHPRRRLRLAHGAGTAWRSTTWCPPRSCWPTGAACGPAPTEHPDLFWALRGGGGNFGVVTEFEFRLHEVGPIVQFGLLFVEQDRAAHALRTARRRDLASFPRGSRPRSSAANAPPAPFVPESHHFAPGIGVIVIGFGTAEEHAAAVAPLRKALAPLFDAVTADAVRRPAADVRRAHVLGRPHLHEGALPRRALRRRRRSHRGAGRSTTAPALADPDLPDGRGVRGGRRRTTRRGAGVATSSTRWSSRRWPPIPRRSPASGSGRATRGRRCFPWRTARAPTSTSLPEVDDRIVRATYGEAKYERLARIKADTTRATCSTVNVNIKPA